MKRALIHSYKFSSLGKDWSHRFEWVISSLQDLGYTVFRDKNLSGLNELPILEDDDPVDIIIYNHADIAEIRSKKLPIADSVWFFKPTVPDENTTTLDELGYGSYSSITYDKPPYENIDDDTVLNFFQSTVQDWISTSSCKWGENHFKETEIPYEDFYLIVGQCGGDAVVTRQDFGGYFEKLEAIVKELLLVDKQRQVVVKLHPYTDGPMENPNQCDIKKPLAKKLESFSPRVKVYYDHSSIHSYLPDCRAVFVGNSGAGFEAMMHDKPIISFCQPEYHWVTYDLRKTCDILNALDFNWWNYSSQRKFLYWYMEKYCFYDYNSAKKRIEELLEEQIEYRVNFL